MHYKILPLAAVALLAVVNSASAQQTAPATRLEVGEWSGTVTDPGGQTVDVLYDVAYAGDTLKIKIKAAEHGTFDTWETRHEAGKISFKFRPGPEVVCVLEKKELIYSGACTADDGSVATMQLAPPKKQKS